MTVLSKALVVFKKYPLIRGMMSYGVIWPLSSLIQQKFEGRNVDNIDWWRVGRFGLFGSCYVAPTLYTWLTIANSVWPGTTLRLGLIKTCVETVTYTPMAMVSFYFGMSLLEMKTIDEAIEEVKVKFWPTYKVGATVWPLVAMFNFCLIPERNKVPFMSMCSLMWCCFLAYMKILAQEEVKRNKHPVQLLKIPVV